MEQRQVIQCTLSTLFPLALPHHPPMLVNDLFLPSRHFLPLFGFHFSLLIIPHEIRRRPRICILPRPAIRTSFTSSVFADVTSVVCFWCARYPVTQASPGTACTASSDGEAVELVACWIVRHCLMMMIVLGLRRWTKKVSKTDDFSAERETCTMILSDNNGWGFYRSK